MQRLLVILVVVLLAAVALMALTVTDLSSSVDEARLQSSRDARRSGTRRGVDSDSDSERLVRVEERLSRTTAENTRLREDIRKLTIRISNLGKVLAARPGTPASSASPGPETSERNYDASGTRVERVRDDAGNFVVSAEEMEYFRAVQTKIDRVRRIDGQTRNYERRIQSIVDRGEIGAILPEQKAEMEKVLRDFVTKNDDLVTRYVRKPVPEVLAMTNDERREQLRVIREKYGAEAQKALAAHVGDADARTIAERVFTNPWGMRSRNFKR